MSSKILVQGRPARRSNFIEYFDPLVVGNLAGQNGWIVDPAFPAPAGRFNVVAGSVLDGINSLVVGVGTVAGPITYYQNAFSPTIATGHAYAVHWSFEVKSGATTPTLSLVLDGTNGAPSNPGGATRTWLWSALADGTHKFSNTILDYALPNVSLNVKHTMDVSISTAGNVMITLDGLLVPVSVAINTGMTHLELSTNMNAVAGDANKMYIDTIVVTESI